MAGSLRKRGDTWQLRYRGVAETFRGSEKQAKVRLADLVTRVEEGRAVGSGRRSVTSLLRAWYLNNADDWSPSTARETRRIIDNVLIPALGDIQLARLGTADIDRFYASQRRRGLSPATVRRIHAYLHSALEQAVRWGWIASNPADRARKPSVPPAKITAPQPDTVARLLEAIADTDLYPFLVLSADTGARRGQLIALRWSDLDLDNGVVKFTATAVHGPDGETIRPLSKTKGRARTVALGATTVRTLTVHRQRMRERALEFGGRLGRDAFLFSDTPTCDRPWRLDTFSHRYLKIRRQAGAADVNLHSLRHYVATQLVAAGVDPRTVAERLGHSRPSTTLDMYAGAVPQKDRDAADLLERLLSGR